MGRTETEDGTETASTTEDWTVTGKPDREDRTETGTTGDWWLLVERKEHFADKGVLLFPRLVNQRGGMRWVARGQGILRGGCWTRASTVARSGNNSSMDRVAPESTSLMRLTRRH